MKTLIQRILVFSLSLFGGSIIADAAILQAKVVEVPAGNVLIVSNINRTLRIRLKSIEPPESGQPFHEAARDHLKLLVLDKIVTVDYTHFGDGYLDAKVMFNDVDIASQMLRDGVVWFDRAMAYELNPTDRELYAQCELAARSEKRGLWQDESPVAPWEYHRIQKAKLDEIANGTPSLRSNATARNNKTLLSSDMSGSFLGGAAAPASLEGLRPIVQNGSFDRWTSFASPVSHFSIMIPSNGLEGSTVVASKGGQPVALDIVVAGSQRTFLVLVSGRGPNENFTDSTAMDKSIRDLIDGMNNGASQRGHSNSELISIRAGRDLRLSGYVGRQYNLSSELFSGTARVFTKQIGDQRQIIVMYVLVREGGEGVASQFLDSLKIDQ